MERISNKPTQYVLGKFRDSFNVLKFKLIEFDFETLERMELALNFVSDIDNPIKPYSLEIWESITHNIDSELIRILDDDFKLAKGMVSGSIFITEEFCLELKDVCFREEGYIKTQDNLVKITQNEFTFINQDMYGDNPTNKLILTKEFFKQIPF